VKKLALLLLLVTIACGPAATDDVEVVGAFMLELPTTLGRLAELEFDALVPGHGEILQDRVHLTLLIQAPTGR
jgi:hypothetical protein